MKVLFKGNIDSFESIGGDVTIKFQTSDGSVETKNIAAKSAALEGTLSLKKLAVQDVKLGSRITIEINIVDSLEDL